MVYVIPGSVREHSIDEMRLDIRGVRCISSKTARIARWSFVLEIPSNFLVVNVGVDEQR
ncbi:unannotated protein [freshwater metagenome]|uniref:Unannotated protein n=1 Tax=freshwater metagenome TaxID=449393 RepID=A0A6J6VAB5_9ZZZZ